MMRKSVLVLTVSAALTVAVFAASSSVQKSRTVTVGEFAMKVSRALGNDSADQQSAVRSLKMSGVNLDAGDLSARLTEGRAAQILADLGMKVSTSNPGGTVSAEKADRMATVAGLSSNASPVSPSDVQIPSECLAQRNGCVPCCKVFFGCDLNSQCDFAKTCTKVCNTVLPPGLASSPEPQP
jgi:hypothetical protein